LQKLRKRKRRHGGNRDPDRERQLNAAVGDQGAELAPESCGVPRLASSATVDPRRNS
jgi:hypothetical protein